MTLFEWESELLRLFLDTLVGVYLCREQVDECRWILGNSKVYTVRSAYDLLLSHSLSLGSLTYPNVVFKNYWSTCVPSKVLAFS